MSTLSKRWPHDRQTVVGIALFAVLIVVLACCVGPTPSHAAPRADSGAECALAADMAIVAASLAQDVERKQADRIMERIYLRVGGEDLSKRRAFLAAILVVAYANRPDAQEFAGQLFAMCVRSRGNMDGILGTDL